MGMIRTLLAITVVCAHSPCWCDSYLVGGRNAVQLFYIISGFLIAHVLQTNKSYVDPMKFYANRVLRIYPIYLAVAVLSLLIYRGGYHYFFEIYREIPASADALLVFSNLFLFGQDEVMFCDVRDGQLVYTFGLPPAQTPLWIGLIVPQAWTLEVELCFYALAPFILRRMPWLIALLLLSAAIRGYLFAIGLGTRDPWSYRFFPAELSLFLLGALAQRYALPAWVAFIAWSNGGPSRASWIPAAGTLAIIAMCLVYGMVPLGDIIRVPALFVLVLVLLPLAFLWQNHSRLDRAIGELSYPIYVCHLMVILSLKALPEIILVTGPIAVTFWNVVASVFFAWVLNRYIGKPIERLRSRVKSDAGSGRSAAAAA